MLKRGTFHVIAMNPVVIAVCRIFTRSILCRSHSFGLELRVTLEVLEAAKNWLGEHGYDHRFGARPPCPSENEIARVLADEVLFGKLAKGGKVTVDVANDKLSFSYPEEPVPVPTLLN